LRGHEGHAPRDRVAHGRARSDRLVPTARRRDDRRIAEGGPRTQPSRGDRARDDESRMDSSEESGLRSKPADVSLLRGTDHDRREAREGGGHERRVVLERRDHRPRRPRRRESQGVAYRFEGELRNTMGLLKRSFAPILPSAWHAVDEEARRVLTLNLAARKL